jgi:ATP-dependent helicase/DNAse subunit B
VKVLAHVDPVLLERELLARVDATHPRGAVGHTLVLVPTNRLAEHLQRKLAGVRPAWLGLEVLPFRGLGRRVLEQADGSTLHVASPLLLEALLRRLLHERPRNGWSKFVGRRPGAVGPMAATFRELREAGIAATDLAACTDGPRTSDLAELFELYDTALGECASAGWTDDAGLAHAAMPHVAGFAEDLDAVFVHGAYELIGVYLDLLRELDHATGVTALVPVARGSRVTSYGERFATSFLDGALHDPDQESDPDRAARLSALYDEESSPPAFATEAVRFRHAQGPAAEVRFAVREALKAVRDGCSPTEIAITARSLEPYTAALEEAFEDAGLPWTSSLGSPLRRHPVAREFLLLLRMLARGFPRDDVIEVLRSRQLRWSAVGCEPPPAEDADAWSREAGILDGLEEWTAELERRATAENVRPEDRENARLIGQALIALNRLVPRGPALWSAHSAELISLLESVFGDPQDEAAGQLRKILDVMAELEQLVGDTRAVEFEQMRTWLEDAVGAARLTLGRDDDGGIRVLDAMQLRGLTFGHVHLLGLNSGLFPRVPRQDPFLTDASRRELRERTRRPLGIKTEGTEEEHQLLAGLIGSARERIDVSWQRADEAGRAKNVSLALREIARLTLGRPDMDHVRETATHIPSHPAECLECLVDDTGLLAPDEEMLLAALHGPVADAAGTLALRFAELAPGLHMLRATQSFEPKNSEFDGRIGPFRPSKRMSVSDIETLGSCPLQFLFGRILRVRPLEEPATPLAMIPKELGNSVHELLDQVYTVLRDERLFGDAPTEKLVTRGLSLLDERRDRVFGELGRRFARRLPLLWKLNAESWFGTLRRFVQDDLRRIGDARARPESFETLRTETLDFGEDVTESIRGKFDRLFDGDDGLRVGDYKTSTSLDDRVNPTQMLKGRTLQVPLYRMMAGPDATVELLGVHPDLDIDGEGHREEFAGFKNDEISGSFMDTMRVLLRMRRDGVFPFHPDDMRCTWCDYTTACRRQHPPTLDRESNLSDAADYRRVLTKSSTKPHGR